MPASPSIPVTFARTPPRVRTPDRRTQLTRPNGITTNYSGVHPERSRGNTLSRLLSVLHQAGMSTIDGATYTVDAAGNRTSKTDQRAGVTSNYSYDALYELTQVTQGANTTESYSYDQVGNRLSSLGLSPYTYNVSNELTSTPTASYTYDYNGNLTSKTDSTGTTNYTWDFENRMTSVTLPGSGGTVTFKYDPYGRRIYKSSSLGTSIYAYDQVNLIEETNASGGVVARYAQGQNIDEPLAMLRNGTTSYYQADGLDSVTSLSNPAGSLAQTYGYDSFGKQTSSSGSLTNPFQYTAREADPETNLYFYRARYYDPANGRFFSEDPVGLAGGLNFYQYVGGNPVLFVDPRGLWRNTGQPADPKLNTIVCNGHGGIRVQLGSPGTPEQAKCYGDCMSAHEERHKQDALRSNPKVCKRAANGIQVGYSNEKERSASEIAASNVELDCLRSKLDHGCSACASLILERIGEMEAYRDSFKK